MLQWGFDRIGDPFEFPANAIFAIRHGVEIQRWDRAVGNYPVMPNFDQLSKNELAGVTGRWRIGMPDNEQYLIGAWSAPLNKDRWLRYTLDRSVRVIVPNILPNDQHATVWLAPAGAKHVKLAWNGKPFFDGDLHDGWNEIGFTIYAPGVGEHELTIASELGTCPNMPRACGVAVHSIDLRVIKQR
jgi:hypothetical protein